MKLLMLLNDGETFTNLDGCAIVGVPDHFEIEDIEEALRERMAHDRSKETESGAVIITVFQDPA